LLFLGFSLFWFFRPFKQVFLLGDQFLKLFFGFEKVVEKLLFPLVEIYIQSFQFICEELGRPAALGLSCLKSIGEHGV